MSVQTISPAEWQVMRVIWAQPHCTSHAIIQALHEQYPWKAPTIKTLLGRLVKKNYVHAQTDHRPFQYCATITEEEHLKREWTQLLNNMCNTKHAELLEQLLTQADLSTANCEQLLTILQTKQKDAPTSVTCHCIAGQCTCSHH